MRSICEDVTMDPVVWFDRANQRFVAWACFSCRVAHVEAVKRQPKRTQLLLGSPLETNSRSSLIRCLHSLRSDCLLKAGVTQLGNAGTGNEQHRELL